MSNDDGRRLGGRRSHIEYRPHGSQLGGQRRRRLVAALAALPEGFRHNRTQLTGKRQLAGVRPERVAKFVNLEGFGLRATRPEEAPERYARWMDELRSPPQLRPYESFDELAARLIAGNKRLSRERADYLARHWGHEKNGKVALRADPAHKIVNATLYRYEEALACWRKVTAPVLWVDGKESETLKRLGLDTGGHAERRAAFRSLRFVEIDGAGHMLHHDQPEALARIVEDFLAG